MGAHWRMGCRGTSTAILLLTDAVGMLRATECVRVQPNARTYPRAVARKTDCVVVREKNAEFTASAKTRSITAGTPVVVAFAFVRSLACAGAKEGTRRWLRTKESKAS